MKPPAVGEMFLGRDRLLVVSQVTHWSGGSGEISMDEYDAKGNFRQISRTFRQFEKTQLKRLSGRAYTHEQLALVSLARRAGAAWETP